VVLVAASDLVGLWHARVALDQLERQLGIERRAVNVVLNRYDARYHHAQSEVEWHLGAPVAAVIPFEHAAIERAIVDQRPLVVDSASRAGRALLALAERINRGKLHVPAETADHARPRTWWRRLLARQVGPTARRSLLEAERIAMRVAPARGGRQW